jgi:Protein kinase domain
MDGGDQFGPYRLQRQLGRGRAGEVFEALDVTRRRTVALRVLPAAIADDDPSRDPSRDPGRESGREFRDRFHREAGLAARLTEPHVVPVHDFGEIQGRFYLDMRLVPGTDLSALLAERGRLPPRTGVEIIAQVAAALDAAHAVGLVHGSLHPGNILVGGGPGSEFAHLADLGIARTIRSAPACPTATGRPGTDLGYAAPELLSGAPADRRTDVYALGCLLFEVLVGQRPFPGEDVAALLHAQLAAPPPRPSQHASGMPAALDGVLARAMAEDPAARYSSGAELATAARLALDGRSVPDGRSASAGPAPARPAPARIALMTAGGGRGRRRLRAGVMVAAVIAGVLAAAGGLLLARAPTTDPAEVLVEPVHSPGELAFLPTAADPDRDVVVPAGAGGPFGGDTPGLFGGSPGVLSCDPGLLVAQLQRDPERAAAWAEPQGVTAARIPSYVARLTAVILRSDTAVTSHRFDAGDVDAVQVVLQAGTGVLVDEFGGPRAKCGSGNPLGPPHLPLRPRYPETAWPGFSPAMIITVRPAAAAITEFTIVDPPTGEVFHRAAGSNGNRDR